MLEDNHGRDGVAALYGGHVETLNALGNMAQTQNHTGLFKGVHNRFFLAAPVGKGAFCVVVGQCHNAPQRAALWTAQYYLAAALLTQQFRQGALVFHRDRQQHLLGNHGRNAVELEQKRGQNFGDGRFHVIKRKRFTADHGVAAIKQHLYFDEPPLHMNAEHVPLIHSPAGYGPLRFDGCAQIMKPVAQHRCLFKFQCARRRRDAVKQLPLEFSAASLEYEQRLFDQARIRLGRDKPNTRRQTLLHLIVNTGPGSVCHHMIRT